MSNKQIACCGIVSDKLQSTFRLLCFCGALYCIACLRSVGRCFEFGRFICDQDRAEFLPKSSAMQQSPLTNAHRCFYGPTSLPRWNTGSNPANIEMSLVGCSRRSTHNFSSFSECSVLPGIKHLRNETSLHTIDIILHLKIKLTLHFLATTCPAGSPPCIGCLIDEFVSECSGVVSSEDKAAIPLCKLESITVPTI